MALPTRIEATEADITLFGLPAGIPTTNDLKRKDLRGDTVFICLDAERECSSDGAGRLTEIGFTLFDMRKIRGREPGDRGKSWVKFFETKHTRITDHWHPEGDVIDHELDCRSQFGSNFAFGHSDLRTYAETIRHFRDRFNNLRNDRHLKGAKVVLVIWEKQMEMETIRELGLGWLEDIHAIYDVQKFPSALAVANSIGKPTCSLENFAEALGIQTYLEDYRLPRGGDKLLHNGGNDSAFEMQAFVASSLLTQEQRGVVEGRSPGGQLLPCVKRHHHTREVHHNRQVAAQYERDHPEHAETDLGRAERARRARQQGDYGGDEVVEEVAAGVEER